MPDFCVAASIVWVSVAVIVATMAATKVLSQREQDIQMMLAADVHLGTKNCDFQMERYVYKRRTDGKIFYFFLRSTNCFLVGSGETDHSFSNATIVLL